MCILHHYEENRKIILSTFYLFIVFFTLKINKPYIQTFQSKNTCTIYDLYAVFSLGSETKPEMPSGSFYKPKFFDFMKEEFLACREGVGIIDMSSFSKIEIKVRNTKSQ